jgi:hypothetical protein
VNTNLATAAKTVSIVSGSSNSCSKIKYVGGGSDSNCKSYTVFILSKKRVRFQFVYWNAWLKANFLDSDVGLTTCDVAPGASRACVYQTKAAAAPRPGGGYDGAGFSLSAALSRITIK